MIPKIEFSKEDFVKILSNYNLGELKKFRKLTAGSVQTNFLIETTKRKFVFRRFENRTLKSVLFEIDLINYLKSKDYPCPAIYKNKNGEYFGIYENKPYIIQEFIEGKHLERPNLNQKRNLIQKVAELQNLTKDYKSPYEKYRCNYDIKLCKRLAKKEANKLKTKNAREKLKWLLKECSKIKLPKSFPKGICHCDFHFSNVLFKERKFKALIDFDDANYTYITFDLISLINPFISSFEWNTWKSFKKIDNVFDFETAKWTVKEYAKHRKLSENEKKYFFDVFKLSVLLDCVWYFKRGDARDFYEKRKVEYLNNLGREEFYRKIFG